MNQRLSNLPLLLALSISIVNCGSEELVRPPIGTSMTLMQPIIGGHAIADNQYSAVGALVVSLPGYEAHPFCTGTLLAPDVVLTASHCLDGVEEFESTGGVLSFSLANDIRSIDDDQESFGFSTFEHISKHPHYSSNFVIPPGRLEACNNPAYDFVDDACGYLDVCLEYTSNEETCLYEAFQSLQKTCEPYRKGACNMGSTQDCTESAASWCFNLAGHTFGLMGLAQQSDIGLVFLDTAINDVTPAQILEQNHQQQLRLGQELHIVGYGQQSPDPETPGTGQKVAAIAEVSEIGPYEVNIGGTESGIQQCYGDSGGPALTIVERGGAVHTILAGVVSRSYESRTCDKGGINTRTSPYLDWIQGEMIRGCTEGLRKSCESHPLAKVFMDLEEPKPSSKREASGGCAATQTNPALFPVWVAGLLLSVFRTRSRRRKRI